MDNEKYKKQKAEDLIEWGMYDKEYSPDNTFSIDYNYFDGERYYKAVPKEISDAEYEELLTCREEIENKKQNKKSFLANEKNEYKIAIPKSLNDVIKMDIYTESVMKTANKISMIGVFLSVIVLIIGIIVAIDSSILSCVPFLVASVIVSFVFTLCSNIIGGISVIMYNTKVSAALALFNNQKD